MRSRTVVVMVALALLGSLLLATGCQKAAEEATEAAIEGATGIDVETDEDKVTIEGEDGSSVEIQSGGELAEDFPSDAPVYDAPIESSGRIGTEGALSWTVVQTTSDDFDEVVAYFEGELASKGWTVNGNTSNTADGSSMAIIGAEKDSLQYTVSVQQDEGQDVSVAISVNQSQ